MRTRIGARGLAVAVLSSVLMLGVAACGGGSDESGPEDRAVQPSGEPSEPTDGPTDGPTDEQPQEGPGGDVDPGPALKAMARAMEKAGTAQVAMDLGVGTARGQVAFGDGTTELALVLESGRQDLAGLELRYVDEQAFMAMPGVTPDGKFFRLDESSTMVGPLIDQLRTVTPAASVELMRGAVKTLTADGHDEIDGERTSHYVVTLDSRKVQELAGGGRLSPGEQSAMPETVAYDLWVTEDDLVRRIVMTSMGVSMQLDYTEWGEPVDIEKPAADDIVETPAGV